MSDVTLEQYSAALDEIHWLRSMMAYEARVIEVQLGYKTMPQRMRAALSASRERHRMGARGEWDAHIQGTSAARHCLRMAEASETLTRSQWEQQRGLTTEPTPDAHPASRESEQAAAGVVS